MTSQSDLQSCSLRAARQLKTHKFLRQLFLSKSISQLFLCFFFWTVVLFECPGPFCQGTPPVFPQNIKRRKYNRAARKQPAYGTSTGSRGWGCHNQDNDDNIFFALRPSICFQSKTYLALIIAWSVSSIDVVCATLREPRKADFFFRIFSHWKPKLTIMGTLTTKAVKR